MAYRRPGVTVTQQFTGLVPALAAFNLPCVAVGPAFQLVTADSVGSYNGSQQTYGYASLAPGALVDLALPPPAGAPNDFAAAHLPVRLVVKNAVVEVLSQKATGQGSGTAFTDATVGQFADVTVGDELVVVASQDVEIVSAKTNGQSFQNTTNRLQAGVAGQFADVKVGDMVTIVGGAPSVASSVAVTAVLPGDLLLLAGAINNGSADSSSVAYSISGDRGGENAGTYKIKTVTNANTLVLSSPLQEAETEVSYRIQRKAGTLTLPRVDELGSDGFYADEAGIQLSDDLVVVINDSLHLLLSGNLYADYRALRTDLASQVLAFTSISDLNAVFGATQITPANPLAYALSIMLQNTVTEVGGLGLDANYFPNEALSFTNAAAVLSLSDVYAIAPLSQNPVVHTLFSNHVTQLSLPAAKQERVALVNSRLVPVAVVQPESTTVTTVNNSVIVVNTKITGSAAVIAPTTLADASLSDIFAGVFPGDKVVIQAGTGVTVGTYAVVSKTNDTTLVLSSNFITAGTASNIQYYIVRLDGLWGDGVTFQDRGATFISNGVAPGHLLRIAAGPLAGRYTVASVVSEKQLTLAPPVPGVAANQSALTYQIERNFTKNEQAELVSGYSASFANRRLVHCWPDVVQAPIGQTVVDLPGYYLGCAIAALTTGLPTQQGFTNLAVSGFLGFKHSTGYFSEAQLNVIADGGTMVFSQDGANQPLYIRHQLTTDRSAIKFQEYSVTKNVDFISKFLRSSFKGFIGRYNIVDSTLDEIKTTATAVLNFLRDGTKLPRVGGVIRGGTLASLVPSDDQIDTLNMVFSLTIPIPLNYIDITVQV